MMLSVLLLVKVVAFIVFIKLKEFKFKLIINQVVLRFLFCYSGCAGVKSANLENDEIGENGGYKFESEPIAKRPLPLITEVNAPPPRG